MCVLRVYIETKKSPFSFINYVIKINKSKKRNSKRLWNTSESYTNACLRAKVVGIFYLLKTQVHTHLWSSTINWARYLLYIWIFPYLQKKKKTCIEWSGGKGTMAPCFIEYANTVKSHRFIQPNSRKHMKAFYIDSKLIKMLSTKIFCFRVIFLLFSIYNFSVLNVRSCFSGESDFASRKWLLRISERDEWFYYVTFEKYIGTYLHV